MTEPTDPALDGVMENLARMSDRALAMAWSISAPQAEANPLAHLITGLAELEMARRWYVAFTAREAASAS